MKKIYIAILTAVLVNGINAQTLTQVNNAPALGDKFYTKQCDSTGIVAGTNGAGQLWNYSTLIMHPAITTSTGVTVASTGSAVAYPTANIAMSSGTYNVFYGSTVGALNFYGGNQALGGLAVILTYTMPAMYQKYPMSLATSGTAAVNGNANVPGLGNGPFTGSNTVTGSGTGTLNLPGASIPGVIKVTTTQNISFTVIVAGTITQNKYEYYTTTSKTPMLSIVTSTVASIAGTTTETIVTINSNYALGLKENTNEVSNLNFYPNPAKGNVNVSFSNPNGDNSSFEMINAIGQTIKKENLGNDKGESKQNISLEGIDSGIYFIKLYVGNAVEVRKITVQ